MISEDDKLQKVPVICAAAEQHIHEDPPFQQGLYTSHVFETSLEISFCIQLYPNLYHFHYIDIDYIYQIIGIIEWRK